jgi:acetate kinase
VTVPSGRVLVLNAGSATLKTTVLDLPASEPRFDRTIDWPMAAQVASGSALDATLDAIVDDGVASSSIVTVGHRVVHGGERFTAPVAIDDETLGGLDDLAGLAPLHNPIAVAVIREARMRLPGIPHVAVFDTALLRHYPSTPGGIRYRMTGWSTTASAGSASTGCRWSGRPGARPTSSGGRFGTFA